MSLTIANNKVGFKAPGSSSTTMSVGGNNFIWSGPDKFSYDSAKKQVLFDSKPISFAGSTETGKYYFLDENGATTQNYIKPVAGGMLRNDENGVAIYDSKSKLINTFSQDEWSKWSDNFKAVGDANYVAASYAIKDLGLSPEDVTVEGSAWKTEDKTISIDNNKATVQTATTKETFVVDNGRKSITAYETKDETGKVTSSFVYGATQWTTQTLDDNGNIVTNSYPVQNFGKNSYVVLGSVDSAGTQISVVKDPYTGKTLYLNANGKPATDIQMEKVDEKSLEEVESKGGAVEEAISVKDLNELPREQREVGVLDFVQYFQQYSGMAGWSSLIFDDKFLENWRTSVNEFFCKTIVLGGIDCWASKICGQYSDITPSRDGVIFTTPVGGAPRAVAHIEAQRSLPIANPEQTVWVYTVTFGLTNPNDEEISYNVVFSGERQASWWNEAPKLGKGGTASAVAASALIKASRHDYSQVCLTFSPPIESFEGKSMSKVCNDITQYSGGATAPYSVVTANETAAAQAVQTTGGSAEGGSV